MTVRSVDCCSVADDDTRLERFEGFRPERNISTIYHCRDIPFWSETLDYCRDIHICQVNED